MSSTPRSPKRLPEDRDYHEVLSDALNGTCDSCGSAGALHYPGRPSHLRCPNCVGKMLDWDTAEQHLIYLLGSHSGGLG